MKTKFFRNFLHFQLTTSIHISVKSLDKWQNLFRQKISLTIFFYDFVEFLSVPELHHSGLLGLYEDLRGVECSKKVPKENWKAFFITKDILFCPFSFFLLLFFTSLTQQLGKYLLKEMWNLVSKEKISFLLPPSPTRIIHEIYTDFED